MGKNFKSISKENKDVCEFRNWDNWYRLNWFNFSSEQNLQDRYFCFDLFLSEQTLNFYNLRSFLFFWLKKDSNFCQVWESVIFTFLFCTACQVKVKDQSKSMQILYKSYIWPMKSFRNRFNFLQFIQSRQLDCKAVWFWLVPRHTIPWWTKPQD